MGKAFSRCREPVNSYTHFIGAVASAAALVLLLVRGIRQGSGPALCAGAVLFAVAMLCLYTASSVYHFSCAGQQVVERLRRVDHSMIYLLIAGSYTPFCISCLPAQVCRVFLPALWGCALAGVVLKNCWMNMPRLLSTGIYLALGWAALAQWKYFAAMPAGCFWLVLLGGVSYSVGGVIYALKKPVLSEKWGSHELFHLFILGGSALHFLAVFFFVL